MNYKLLAVIGLAVLLRGAQAATQGEWYDEAFTRWMIGLEWGEMIEALKGDVHPAGYYVIAKVVGDGRLVSVMSGGLMAGMMYKGWGWKAGLMGAVIPELVYYGVEGRMYGLMTMGVVLGMLGVKEGVGWKVVVGSWIGMWVQNLGVIYGVILGGLWFLQKREKGLKEVIGIGIGMIPVAMSAMGQMGEVGKEYWVRFDMPIERMVVVYMLMYGELVIGYGASLVLTVIGLIKGRGLERVMIVLPTLMLAAISIVWRPVFLPRILLPVTAACGMAMGRAHTAFVIAMTAIALLMPLGGTPRGNQREILEQLGPEPVYYTELYPAVVIGVYRPGIVAKTESRLLGFGLTEQTKRAMGLVEGNIRLACEGAEWVNVLGVDHSLRKITLVRLQCLDSSSIVE